MLPAYMLFIALFGSLIHGTEIDNFTGRFGPLNDVSVEVNRIVNRYFDEAIAVANRQKSCDEQVLFVPLSKLIGTGFVSEIEKEVQNNRSIDQVFTRRKESIYRDFRIFDAPGIFLTDLASLIKVNNIIIGTDKLGHFLGTGFSYYERLHYQGKTLAKVLKYGDRTERSYYGMLINGVYSYADLAANLDGLAFWERILQQSESQPFSSYVECKDNHWSKINDFRIEDYVNSAWDESKNCNRYRSDRLRRKVVQRIAMLGYKASISQECLVEREECKGMIERYGDNSRSVISPICLAQ